MRLVMAAILFDNKKKSRLNTQLNIPLVLHKKKKSYRMEQYESRY